MTEADPDNELGHFSLGKALVDAERFADAENPLRRTLELNPTQSKAYELLGLALMRLGRRAESVDTLRRGYEVAAERGDVMPRKAMGELLVELGESPPAVAATPPQPVETNATNCADGFRCSRCGRPNGQLAERPFKGALGESVLANVCQSCWREWIGMGTKVINEMGLPLADPRAQATFDEHMQEFLQLPE